MGMVGDGDGDERRGDSVSESVRESVALGVSQCN